MPTFRLPVTSRWFLPLAVALVAIACGPTASSSPSGAPPSGTPASPSASPSNGPTVGAIEHPTGATEVVLRLETGGGFVPIDFLATQAPSFTLYGNGVIVFQTTVTTFPEPDANGVTRAIPWRTATLDEGQIQELLEFALGPGGLGAARDSYIDGGIADAPDTIFTIHAGGVDKTVVVNALSEEPRPGADALARTAFWKVAKRLQDFDQGGTISSDVYVSDRYRGVLIERDPGQGGVAMEWPWPALAPADFKESANGAGGPALPHRVMTADEVAALKLTDIEGGVQGLVLKAPSDKSAGLVQKFYGFILRPLLADEKE